MKSTKKLLYSFFILIVLSFVMIPGIAAAAAPVAAFNSDVQTGTAPLTVQFTDASTGTGPLTYAWDFNNDGTVDSGVQNPSFTYVSAGSYTVMLNVTGPDGSDDEVKTDYITVTATPVAPTAAFTATPTYLSVQFTNQSTGTAPLTYAWDFGDGGSSTVPSPSHTYAGAGTYPVKLTVTGPGGNDNVTHSVTVSAAPVAPTAAFTATPTYLSVQFTNQSTGTAPLTYAWDFGDGGSSVLPSPSHTYAGAGTYPVKLTVTGPGGNDNVTHSVTVSAAPVAPTAAFTATPTYLSVQFTNQSTGTAPLTYAWDFGDGGLSTLPSPSHTYAGAGTYPVKLTVTGPGGNNNVTHSVTVSAAPVAPIAAFTTSIHSGTAPLAVLFTDTSSNTPTAWSWSFKDVTGNTTQVVFSTIQNPVHTFDVGNYSVELNASNSAGYGISTQLTFINVTKRTNEMFTTGVYRPGVGFYLKMDNGSTWNPSIDVYLAWDNAVNDLPVAGDWNSDGSIETGVYRPGVGFYLKMDNGSTWNPSTDVYLGWDNANGDLPVAGDWNNDGRTETGVYRPGAGFYLKMDGGGTWNPSTDVYLAWDNAAVDLPVANDWNSDGRTETGVYRPGVGFYLKMDGGGTWNPSTDVYLGWDNANGDLPIAVRGNVPSAAKPSIISIFPNDGTAGTLISITELTGTNFQSGASVTLMKSGSPNITAGNVIVRSPTLITCTVLPALDATPGSWDVVVTNPDGQYSVNTNMFIIHSAVTGITSISPTFIYTSSVYLPITVYGSNFQNVRSAKLTLIGHADIIAQITPISGAQMNCYFTIPVFSQGTWSLVLTNNDGTTSRLENAFTVLSNYVE